MANITVLGAGLVGKAIALDLAEQHTVTAVDASEKALNRLLERNAAIKTVKADLHVTENIIRNIESADVVVSAVPGFMGYATLETVIRAHRNVVDIAFFPEDALALDELARQHRVTAIVDIGVAPGLSHLILGYHSTTMDIESFKCMVGGLPKYPEPPFNYKAPFSPVDVIEEYTRPVRLVRNGKVITLPALSEIETVEFENIGKLEAFNTDGLRTLIESFPEIPDMVEKTLRYPGHASLMQTLIDIGFLNNEEIKTDGGAVIPRHLTEELLKQHWKLESDEEEFTIMQIELTGREKTNREKTLSCHYFLYDEYNRKTGTGSMARTTGYTCTAAVNLLLTGLFDQTGVVAPERLSQQPGCFESILEFYEDRNIKLEKSIVTITDTSSGN